MTDNEKLRAFHCYGMEKDEMPLRRDASIWTTGLNMGVNCAQKLMKIHFRENDGIICGFGL